MAGFKGQAEYSVDNKGRIAIPAKMRSALNPEANNSFTITRGLDSCIFLYPSDHWKTIERGFEQLNMYEEENRVFLRNILRWAEDVELDGQGRISIPKSLQEKAKIGDRALILGALDHIEIWNPELFDEYIEKEDARYESVAERVMAQRNGTGGS